MDARLDPKGIPSYSPFPIIVHSTLNGYSKSGKFCIHNFQHLAENKTIFACFKICEIFFLS